MRLNTYGTSTSAAETTSSRAQRRFGNTYPSTFKRIKFRMELLREFDEQKDNFHNRNTVFPLGRAKPSLP